MYRLINLLHTAPIQSTQYWQQVCIQLQTFTQSLQRSTLLGIKTRLSGFLSNRFYTLFFKRSFWHIFMRHIGQSRNTFRVFHFKHRVVRHPVAKALFYSASNEE